jgi:hypothetical protein
MIVTWLSYEMNNHDLFELFIIRISMYVNKEVTYGKHQDCVMIP